jgi:flagellar basal body-associated protein FliL
MKTIKMIFKMISVIILCVLVLVLIIPVYALAVLIHFSETKNNPNANSKIPGDLLHTRTGQLN